MDFRGLETAHEPYFSEVVGNCGQSWLIVGSVQTPLREGREPIDTTFILSVPAGTTEGPETRGRAGVSRPTHALEGTQVSRPPSMRFWSVCLYDNVEKSDSTTLVFNI